MELEYNIYLHQQDSDISISVPAYDIYDKPCYKVASKEGHFCIRYYKYIFIYNTDISSERIQITDNDKRRIFFVPIWSILPEEYFDKSRRIDRLKLLSEEYLCINNTLIDFRYEPVRIFYPFTEAWMHGSDELILVSEGLKWFTKHIIHTPKDLLHFYGTAADIYYEALAVDQKMNCKNMALVLNAIYLSLGIRSRYIECIQLENRIDNCHFVVETYITKWQKWILVDSSYGLMFKDENGCYLSLRELRWRLATEQDVDLVMLFRPINKKLYFYNLVRKLYRFVRACISCDAYYEGMSQVELRPLKKETYGEKNIMVTDCPELFWKY